MAHFYVNRCHPSKGGRPRKPNLFIKFSKSVWDAPDPKLLKVLYLATGATDWLPEEQGDEREGPYVRVHVPEITSGLEKLLSNSLNVFEWDNKGLYRVCALHANLLCRELPSAEQAGAYCKCGSPATLIY
jgi:hypothetical protein